MASYETFEKKHFVAVASTEVAKAAHEEFKKAVAELLEHHLSDREVQKMRGDLEVSTHRLERLELCREESQREIVRLRSVNADLLSQAISRLDELKR